MDEWEADREKAIARWHATVVVTRRRLGRLQAQLDETEKMLAEAERDLNEIKARKPRNPPNG